MNTNNTNNTTHNNTSSKDNASNTSGVKNANAGLNAERSTSNQSAERDSSNQFANRESSNQSANRESNDSNQFGSRESAGDISGQLLEGLDRQVMDLIQKRPLVSMLGVIAAGYLADLWMARKNTTSSESRSFAPVRNLAASAKEATRASSN